jgi:hypothetical protein
MFFIFLISLIIPGWSVLLTFDDVSVLNQEGYLILAPPYHQFIIIGVATNFTPWDIKGIPVGNVTTLINTAPAYKLAAVSWPNFIFTQAENLSFNFSDGRTFYVRQLYLTSIFLDQMNVTLRGYRSSSLIWEQLVTLPLGSPMVVNLPSQKVDYLLIGCTSLLITQCLHVAYDNIEVEY